MDEGRLFNLRLKMVNYSEVCRCSRQPRGAPWLPTSPVLQNITRWSYPKPLLGVPAGNDNHRFRGRAKYALGASLLRFFLRREFSQHEFLKLMVTSRTKVLFRFMVLVLYKTGGLPCGSLTTLIPPLRMVFLESRPSQGLPNFGITLQYEVVEGRGSCVLVSTPHETCVPCEKFLTVSVAQVPVAAIHNFNVYHDSSMAIDTPHLAELCTRRARVSHASLETTSLEKQENGIRGLWSSVSLSHRKHPIAVQSLLPFYS
jgi:hypothetical protein